MNINVRQATKKQLINKLHTREYPKRFIYFVVDG